MAKQTFRNEEKANDFASKVNGRMDGESDGKITVHYEPKYRAPEK